ncbi:hypothetical protein ADN01_00640 [Levilinea saccharolytica]|uniref:Ribosome maturation factor RimM n=1 Tax=Levilinea saccharolytica TaxID=229921 RepID=A0A0P6YMG7_9CHLR|nr:hypothetical protein ADN01_00640 [Levilinea saccharolytica]
MVSSEDHQQPTGSPVEGEPVYLAVGLLRKPHGVKGEISMQVLTDFPERLRKGKVILVGEDHRPLKIEAVRWHGNSLLLKFAEFSDCDEVGVLRNLMVYVSAKELPALPEGEYYYHQLIGLSVVDEAGQTLGELAEILETRANDVYVVKDESGKELLLPVTDEVILRVDLAAGEMVVRPPEWL